MKKITLFLLTAITVFGCTKSSVRPTGTVALNMTASTPTNKPTIGGRVQSSAVVISEFQLSLKGIKFEFDENDDHFKKDSSYNDDIKLKGPFIVNLLNAGAFVKQQLTKVDLPNATYKEVEFKIYPSQDQSSKLFGKSILIVGTINGKPFTFSNNIEEDFHVNYEVLSKRLSVNSNNAAIKIDISLDKLFNPLNGGQDLGSAKDGNGDGKIEIGPTDNDDNHDLSDVIRKLLKKIINIKDDQN